MEAVLISVYIVVAQFNPSPTMNLSDPLTIAPPAEAVEAGASQAVKAQLRLREHRIRLADPSRSA